MAICEKCQRFDGMTPAGIRCANGSSTVLVNKRKTRCKQFRDVSDTREEPVRVRADDVIDGPIEEPKTIRIRKGSHGFQERPAKLPEVLPVNEECLPQKTQKPVERHGFRAVRVDDIPGVSLLQTGGKNGWIREVLSDFMASGDEAWEVDKDPCGAFLDAKAAKNLAGSMRKQINDAKTSCKVIQRAEKLYLVRITS